MTSLKKLLENDGEGRRKNKKWNQYINRQVKQGKMSASQGEKDKVKISRGGAGYKPEPKWARDANDPVPSWMKDSEIDNDKKRDHGASDSTPRDASDHPYRSDEATEPYSNDPDAPGYNNWKGHEWQHQGKPIPKNTQPPRGAKTKPDNNGQYHIFTPLESTMISKKQIREMVREAMQGQIAAFHEAGPAADEAKRQGLHHVGFGMYANADDAVVAKSDGKRLIPVKSTGTETQPKANPKQQTVTPTAPQGDSMGGEEGDWNHEDNSWDGADGWKVDTETLVQHNIGHFVVPSDQIESLKKLRTILTTVEHGVIVKKEDAPGGLKRYHVFYKSGHVQ